MILIQPKVIEVCGKSFIISKFPALTGRKIVTQFFSTAVPKLGNYGENEALAIEMMKFVGVPRDTNEPLILSTKELINAHVDDWVMQLQIEKEMLEYNCANFPLGRILDSLKSSIMDILPSIMSTLTGSLRQSLAKDSQPSTNLEQSTP